MAAAVLLYFGGRRRLTHCRGSNLRNIWIDVDSLVYAAHPAVKLDGIFQDVIFDRMAHFTIDITDTEICLTPIGDHMFTLLWIHGLNETPQMHLRYLLS